MLLSKFLLDRFKGEVEEEVVPKGSGEMQCGLLGGIVFGMNSQYDGEAAQHNKH